MSIGAIIPSSGPLPLSLGVGEMAAAAESAGAASVWVSDHLLMVDAPVTGYPYSADGRPTWKATDDYLEALTTCGYLAAATTSCLIGTAALVIPQRNVLQLAKEVATIDRLSGGRFVLGAAAGWYEAEMNALGYGFGDRGRRLDEMLDVLQQCWTGRPAAYDGTTVHVPDGIVLHPTPAESQGPPLLVGGMTGPAVRRAASRGDGWLALAFVERWNPSDIAAALARFREQRHQRSGDAGYAALKLHCGPERHGELRECARQALDAGFDHVVVEPPWGLGVPLATQVIKDIVSASPPPVLPRRPRPPRRA
ncbi:LLM class F420-dependent oxidoreductase [Sphaerisporangium rufum]|uniref:LLM class F420-dependent oxidoreductase n=1 Tax=Sphaerisporangium rufum TaxID=1381558 RepID=A0A919UYX3_9ACTN|nr:TIGR03619 family F420-dependent LLM class oxidoreductase [Sphaerisporangium rufum]GII78491.1 LLM class F420-dependent oxidoreductase [Sphaerisporangium rufum]